MMAKGTEVISFSRPTILSPNHLDEAATITKMVSPRCGHQTFARLGQGLARHHRLALLSPCSLREAGLRARYLNT